MSSSDNFLQIVSEAKIHNLKFKSKLKDISVIPGQTKLERVPL